MDTLKVVRLASGKTERKSIFNLFGLEEILKKLSLTVDVGKILYMRAESLDKRIFQRLNTDASL